MENYRIKNAYFSHPKNETIHIEKWVYDDYGILQNIITNENEIETKFFYNNDLLVLMEQYIEGEKERFWIFEYDEKNNIEPKLLKKITYDKEGNVKNYSKYIFEDKLLLKTIKYSPNDILEYELFNKYDKNNNRISTYYQNKKIYSTRKYNNKKLLEKIIYASGGDVTFTWESGFTNYDLNMYYIC